MTQDPKAVARRYYELMESPERFDEVIASDVKGHAGASADGLEEFTASQQSFREAFPDLRAEVSYLVEEDELVSSWISYLGTHDGAFAGVAPTGREIKIMGWDLMRVRDGKIVEITSSCDLFTLMNQIGALSTAAPA